MTTLDFITELFCRVDDVLADVPKHSQAKLSRSPCCLRSEGWATARFIAG